MKRWIARSFCALAAGVGAERACAQPVVVGDGDWAFKPSAAQLRTAWPAEITAPLRTSIVYLECATDPQGALANCKVVGENPPDKGLGTAALSLAPSYRLKVNGARPPEAVRFSVDLDFPLDSKPDWLKRPRPEDLLAVWPAEALRASKGGKATIDCAITIHGALNDCVVIDESPAGSNFGVAAIALTPQLLMKPATYKGQPIISYARIPMVFHKPDRPANNEPPANFGSRMVVTPAQSWISAPSYSDVVAAYPAKARESGVGGHVNLNCQFSKDGVLRSCRVLQEEPKGQGFGAAAKILSRRFLANPTLDNGKPITGVMVQIPITFAPGMLSDGPRTIGKPLWTAMPSPAQVVFPGAAAKAGVEDGRAILACQVQAGGRLDCKLEKEEPPGLGFGEAAMNMAPHFRLSTWTVEGLPVIGGVVRWPVRFQAPKEAPGAARNP